MGNHCSCPDSSRIAYTRQGTRKRCNPKANTNRVSSLLGYQLCSALFLVQATDMSWHKAANNTCTYMPTRGMTAEEVPGGGCNLSLSIFYRVGGL